jgi:hypothetical protein
MSTGVRINGWDDVDISLIPTAAAVIFYYADGTYVEREATLKSRAPDAVLVPIAVRAGFVVPKARRLYLDDEPGDADDEEIVGWYHEAKDVAVELPGIYSSIANGQAVVNIMTAAGFVYGVDYLFWSAHYTSVPHLCNPSCGFGFKEVAHNTQYEDNAFGKNLDADECTDLGVGIAAVLPPGLASLLPQERAAVGNYEHLLHHWARTHPHHIAAAKALIVDMEHAIETAAAKTGWTIENRRARFDYLTSIVPRGE